MSEPAAVLLDAAGPLAVLAAQLVYLGQPLVGSAASTPQWEALAHMLEHQEESRSFAAFLREEKCQ